MKEQGIVVDLIDNMARIMIKRNHACEKCGACKIGGHSQEMILELDNTINAVKGDMVEIALEDSSIIKAAIYIYVFPLTLFILGIIGGIYLFQNEFIGLIMGIVLLIFTYYAIRELDKRIKSKTLSPKITAIIRDDS